MAFLSKPKTNPSKGRHAPAPASAPAKPAAPKLAPPPPPPLPRYLARCTFVGEEKKVRVEGSFRFVAEAADSAAMLAKLEKAVNKLRRARELPSHCEVFVEFMLELADLKPGLVADFERWERHPRRFQAGHITLSENCPVFVESLPTYRFGKPSG